MMDQRISGLVHNRLFPYQPCNYKAGGKVGMYCKGQWQGGLLNSDSVLGTCTLNTEDCGAVSALRWGGGVGFLGGGGGGSNRPGVHCRR